MRLDQPFTLEPVTLTGTHVRLEPFAEEHIADLWRVGYHPELWQYMPFDVGSEDRLGALVRGAMKIAAAGGGLGLVQRALPDDVVVGATGYWNVDATHRRVEIGGTWLTPQWQRTAVNTEAKLLLLTHAFDTLRCIRVEFKTDSLNVRSRQALQRIGAIEEGTLRNHMVMPDGRYRHSTYFSILETEWPAVRERLTTMLHPRP